MDNKQRRDNYLAKAKEAEAEAAKATSEDNKASWLRIAAGYHNLAADQGEQDQ